MFRTCPFLWVGLAMTTLGAAALSGCGGDEFGAADPNTEPDRDAALDTQGPKNDGSSSGGTGGSGGSGSGGKAGKGGNGGGGSGGSAPGDGRSDGPVNDGMVISPDAPRDIASPDAADGAVDDGPRTDGSRPSDVADGATFDIPTGIDGPTSSDANDGASGDAASDASVVDARDGAADAACSELITYYKDEDGDGFGRTDQSTMSCTSPGNKWSTSGGDCRDDLPSVRPYKPGQPNPPLYSGAGYPDTSKPQGVSFDFDCTGAEEADPANSYGVEPNCALLNCTGVGYVPINPGRNGPGIDPRCGSTTLTRCNGNLLNCQSLQEATTIPYRCR